jgi:hypothetical protein
MFGLFGYLVALVAFGYEGLFSGREDAHDQLLGGMAAAYLVVLVATVVVLVAAVRMRRRRWAVAGLLTGMAIGVTLMVLLSLRIFDLMGDVASTCPCDPIVDQVRFSHQPW